MPPPVVFLGITGPNSAALRDFDSSVFGWEFDEAGRFDLEAASVIRGAIREDPAEMRACLGVPGVTEVPSLVEMDGDRPRIP